TGLAQPPVERGDDDRLCAAVGEVDVGGGGESAVHVLLTVDLHGVPHAGHGATRGDGLLQRCGAARLEYLPLAGFDVDRGDAQVAFGVPLRAPEPRANHLPARLGALCALGEGEGADGAAGGIDVAAN